MENWLENGIRHVPGQYVTDQAKDRFETINLTDRDRAANGGGYENESQETSGNFRFILWKRLLLLLLWYRSELLKETVTKFIEPFSRK